MDIKARFYEDEKVLNLYITGEIGYSIDAGDFIRTLSYYKDYRIEATMFSFGGNPFHAIAIYDYITTQGIDFHAKIYGMCGSACTIISCGAKSVQIGANSFFFVHNAYNKNTQSSSELLEKVNTRMAKIYALKTNKSVEEMTELMSKGDGNAVFDAEQAVEAGFVDSILTETNAIAASFKDGFIDFKELDIAANLTKDIPEKTQPTNGLVSVVTHNKQKIIPMDFKLLKAQLTRLFGMTVEDGSDEQETLNNIAAELEKRKSTAELQTDIVASVSTSVNENLPTQIKAQVDGLFTDMNTRLEGIKASTATFAEKDVVAQMSAKMETSTAAITAAAKAIEDLTASVEALKTKVDTMETEKQSLETQIVALKKPKGAETSQGVDFTKAERQFKDAVASFDNETKY